ncbi:MAG: hypothetical protein CL569_09235 [Alphaproteobacteria bacterium]|nr:hypothetical protein [Alphaproteobacteria bacterium]
MGRRRLIDASVYRPAEGREIARAGFMVRDNKLRTLVVTSLTVLATPEGGRAADSGQIGATSTATSSVSLTIPERVTFDVEAITEINAETGELDHGRVGAMRFRKIC